MMTAVKIIDTAHPTAIGRQYWTTRRVKAKMVHRWSSSRASPDRPDSFAVILFDTMIPF